MMGNNLAYVSGVLSECYGTHIKLSKGLPIWFNYKNSVFFFSGHVPWDGGWQQSLKELENRLESPLDVWNIPMVWLVWAIAWYDRYSGYAKPQQNTGKNLGYDPAHTRHFEHPLILMEQLRTHLDLLHCNQWGKCAFLTHLWPVNFAVLHIALAKNIFLDYSEALNT